MEQSWKCKGQKGTTGGPYKGHDVGKTRDHKNNNARQ